MARDVDILLISLGTTRGLRLADEAFAALLQEAGASVALSGVALGHASRLRRAYPLIDLVEALAARRATPGPVLRLRPRAVVFSATTAALMAPRLAVPYAVRLDSPALLNRPGRRNAIQHALERRRLRAARLVLPTGRASATALPPDAARAVVVPPPVIAAPAATGSRERLAIAYAPDPKAKGLDVVCAAWGLARPDGARLAVFGIDAERGSAFLRRRGIAEPPGLEWRGMTSAAEFRATLRRSRAFVVGARWEDFGLAQLEALADGALLVTVPAAGAYEALPIARALEPALVSADAGAAALGSALRAAFALGDDRVARYRAEAAVRLAPYRPASIRSIIETDVLPALLRGA